MRGLGRILLAAAILAAAGPGLARPTGFGAVAPTGQTLTPNAAPGALFQPLNPGLAHWPGFLAGQASAIALSPDGKSLLILTSGFNRMAGPDGKGDAEASNEYVFVYDVSGATPVKRQVLQIPNSFLGLVWAPDGARFYVSGGMNDDVIEFALGPGGWAQARSIALGHEAGLGIGVEPEVAGLAISPDGRRLLAANLENDSVSLIDLDRGAVVAELDLRPGVLDPARSGAPGGTFPQPVVWVSNQKAYVGTLRDRELITLDITGDRLSVGARIKLRGQPTAFVASQDRRLVYASMDNTDGVAVLDAAADQLLGVIATAGPEAPAGAELGGAGSNALVLSPEGSTLYVANGGENAIAVVRLSPDGRSGLAVGLVPTGWYPTGVAVARDGGRLFAVNGKSNPGPNLGACRNTLALSQAVLVPCKATNQYVWQLEKAGFLSLPTPPSQTLARLTAQVLANNHAGPQGRAQDAAMMAFLHARIRHVIYIVKENRTYDQVLGDLGEGDGDPALELFPATIAPNHHALARRFVDLDAFRDSGESSNTGWDWSTAARTNDFTEREAPVNYAARGLSYDQEGGDRDVNVAIADPKARHAARARNPDDPNLLAGTADVAAPDGPDADEGEGYIWDAALKAQIGVRNWGFFGDLSRYSAGEPDAIPREREPWKSSLQVFFPTNVALAKVTDPYYRGFDQAFPDYWRFQEWKREFAAFEQAGRAPGLMLLRLPHDHFGDFKDGIDGVNAVETEMADNDYALGLIIETVARSRFASDTLIFVVEDDAQDGPDHVDAHRSIAFIVGPYVKRGAVVSTPYTTVSLLKTMEGVLGLKPMNLNDARAAPMTAVFDRTAAHWTYKAIVPPALRVTRLPLPPPGQGEPAPPSIHSAAYWDGAMAGQNFAVEDHLDTAAFNRALWKGMKEEPPAQAPASTPKAR
jgi:DNA-binding beta-propeller fold protein YncE